MELINRYINEVGRRLPKKMRADVETELNSLLMDSIEERMSVTDAADVPEEIQVAVLKEFGPPQQVAQQYNPKINYIIGPRLYESYLITIAVVLGITFVAHLVGMITLSVNPNTTDALVNAIAGLVTSLQAGLGGITLVFALIERAVPDTESQQKTTTWDPRKLPKIADHDRIKPSGLIVETVFLVFLLVILNLYPDRIGLSFVKIGAEFKMTSWLAPGFHQTYGIWLSAWWFLTICLNVYVLYKARWQRITHIFHVALLLIGAFLFYQMATGPNFIVTAPGGIIGDLVDVPDIINQITGQSLKVVLIVIMVTHIFSAMKILYNVFNLQPFIILTKDDSQKTL